MPVFILFSGSKKNNLVNIKAKNGWGAQICSCLTVFLRMVTNLPNNLKRISHAPLYRQQLTR